MQPSSVRFSSKCICATKSTILLEVMSPTKQAKGDSGKEPKYLVTEMEGKKTKKQTTNLVRNQAQLGGGDYLSSGQMKPAWCGLPFGVTVLRTTV